MILDSFQLHSMVFQIVYPAAYCLWDRSGEIASRVCKIWPDLEIDDAKPDNQLFKSKSVVIQTGLKKSTITLTGPNPLEASNIKSMKETYDVWKNGMELSDLERVSTLTVYKKEFSTIKEANSKLFKLNVVNWPSGKVFDQPHDADRNSFELLYRFEDQESFSTLRLKTEQTKYVVSLDPKYVEESEISVTKNHLIIIFDRGLLGKSYADKLRVDDWINGYKHVLRRDLEKVIGA